MKQRMVLNHLALIWSLAICNRLNAMYRKKLKIFIYAATVLIVAAYSFGFRKTITVNKNLNALREKVEIVNRSETLKMELVGRLALLDNQLGSIQVTNNDQEYVLRTIHNNKDVNNVRIIEVLGTTVEAQNGISRRTFGATVEGNFTDILKTVRSFEASGQNGELVSLKFYRFTEPKTKRSSTRCEFFIQKLDIK